MPETKTVISIAKPTPMWATWVFRGALFAATTVTQIVQGAPNMTPEQKATWMYWAGTALTVIWGLSRLVGLEISEQPAKEEKK